jgi:hypothetical protein
MHTAEVYGSLFQTLFSSSRLLLRFCPRTFEIAHLTKEKTSPFLTQVYRDSILCPSALEIVGLRVPVRYTRDLPMFSVYSVSKNCPSSRCASAANVICRDVNVIEPKTRSLKHILYWIIKLLLLFYILMCLNLNCFFAVTLWLCLYTFCLFNFIHSHFVIDHWAVKLACK